MDTLSTALEDTTFPLSRRGYDTSTVDKFMDNLKDLVATLEGRLMLSISKSGSLESQMRAVGDAEHVAEAAFLAAADAKRRLIAQAERKAADIIAEANSEAARLLGKPEKAVEQARLKADEMLSDAVKRIDASDAEAGRILERAELTARTMVIDAEHKARDLANNAHQTTSSDIAHATREYERIQVLLNSLKQAVAESVDSLSTAYPTSARGQDLALDLNATEQTVSTVSEIR